MASIIRLLGRRKTSGDNLIDKAVAVDDTYSQAGKLQVQINPGNIVGSRTIVGSVWAVNVSGTTAAPRMLTKVEVNNPTGGDILLRLAVMTVSDGTPSTSNALLAWDTTVPAGGQWNWVGEIPLVGRYFYSRGASLGMSIYSEYQELTPA